MHKRQNLTGKLTVKIISAKNLIKYEALTEAICVIRVFANLIFDLFFHLFIALPSFAFIIPLLFSQVDNVVKSKTKPKLKTVKPMWNEVSVLHPSCQPNSRVNLTPPP